MPWEIWGPRIIFYTKMLNGFLMEMTLWLPCDAQDVLRGVSDATAFPDIYRGEIVADLTGLPT